MQFVFLSFKSVYMSAVWFLFAHEAETLSCAPSVSLIWTDLVPLWHEQPQPLDSGGPGDDLSRRVDTGAAALLPSHRRRGVPLRLLWSVASSLCLSCSRKLNTWQVIAVCCLQCSGLRGCQSAGDLTKSVASHLAWDQAEVDSQSLWGTKGKVLSPLFKVVQKGPNHLEF